jgi:hypothetical protein
MASQGLTAGQIGLAAQGFLTSDDRFVCRRPALQIAREAKQLIRKTAPEDELFSEDVW